MKVFKHIERCSLRLAGVAMLWAVAACQPGPEAGTTRFSELKVEDRLRYYNVPGVSIAIIHHYRVVALHTYGYADAQTREPLGEDTRLQAASISKPVASAAALKKVQEGKLLLEGDINAALRSWQLPGNAYTAARPVTLRHLLSHSGGVSVSGFPGYASHEAVPDLGQILAGEHPANNPPIEVKAPPGTAYAYSGGGYCVVQQALVDVEGKAFPAIVQETVLEPLQMTNSAFGVPGPATRAAAGHHTSGKTMAGKWNAYPELAAAGLWSTPADLARFAIALQLSAAGTPGSLLSADLARLMTTPYVGCTYGLGLEIHRGTANTYFSHSGSTVGFQCQLIAHRDKGYGAVVMTNSDNGLKLAREIIRSISLEYNWEEYPL